MSEWISVKDRMPKVDQVVLVHGGIAYWDGRTDEWMTITGEQWPGRRINWQVTHWMPMPEPPQE